MLEASAPVGTKVRFPAWRVVLRISLACLLVAVCGQTAKAQSPPLSEQELASAWGPLYQLAGGDYGLVYESAGPLGVSYRWQNDGLILVETMWSVSRDRAGQLLTVTLSTATFTLDPTARRITITTRTPVRTFSGTATAFSGPDELITDFGPEHRGILRSLGNGRFRSIVGQVRNGQFRETQSGQILPLAESPESVQLASARRQIEFPLQPRRQAFAAAAPTIAPIPATPAIQPPPVTSRLEPVVGIAAQGPRVALVLGVSNYGTLGNLTNPRNDATAIANRLRALGFDVELVLDANQRAMKDAISRLGERMGRAGAGATGLFYFAGHGIQSRGTNYLIPAGAAINREADLDLEGVAADTVLSQMQEAGASTNIIILDACRNMPLTRSFRNSGRGLAQMEAPNGTFIAYSTAPGSVAADGSGANSPFAAALLQEIGRPGQPIETVFRNVRRSVVRETEGLQTPWDSSSLLDPFFFAPDEAS